MGLVQKSFSDIITFSRSSNATRVGPTGVLEYAPHNLILQSQTFNNASWLLLDSSISANSAAAPDGTVTADKLVENTANSNHTVYQAGITTVTATVSVYAKAAGRSNLIIRQYQADTEVVSANFDLSAGTVSKTLNQGTTFTSPLYSITPVGNGWYRCTVTATRSSGTTVVAFDLSNTSNPTFRNGGDVNYTGDGTSGIYLWGAQLAVGPYALDYTPTTSAAVYGPRFDYNGSGVTIVEPVSTNLVTYSEQFDNAYWTKANVTVTANAIVAPDGTMSADLLYPTTSGAKNTHRLIGTITVSNNTAYTASMFVKTAGKQWVYFAAPDASAPAYDCWFDVVNGVVGTKGVSVTSATITNVGNGWFRLSVTSTSTSTGNYIFITPVDADNSSTITASGTSGIYIWGAQLEVGSTATAYMVSGATNGFRAVPVVSGSATARGLLVEEQRTNLCLYSEQFDNAWWSKTTATVTANLIASPDGTVTADLVTATAGGGGATVVSSGITVVSSTAYTYSIFIKAGTATSIQLRLTDNVTGQAIVTANLLTGATTVSAGPFGSVTASSVQYGNSWWRFIVTGTQPAGQTSASVGVYLLNNADTVYLWGAQLEAGSFATSLIPTLASTVTRSADVASVNTLSPWFNATAGTLYTELERYASSQEVRGSIFYDGTTNNYIASSAYTFSGQGGVVVSGGVGQASLGAGSSSPGVRKFAFAFSTNDFALSENGGAVTTDTSGTLPTVTTLGIGSLTSSLVGTGYIRRIAYYPRRLTNAELQALTA